MGKFIYALLMVSIIEIALWFFGGFDDGVTSLTSVLLNPTSVSGGLFYIGIVLSLVTAFSVSAIVPGNTFSWTFVSVYAVTAGLLVTFGLSIVHLATFMQRQLEGLISTDLTQFIITITVGPLIVFYFISCLEWIRGNT